jgi:hypothetical protein
MTIAMQAKSLAKRAFDAIGVEVQLKPYRTALPEIPEDKWQLIQACAPYTMTTPQRQWALLTSVEHIDRHGIPGDIVECGVWRGGNMMLARLARKINTPFRRYRLFDTFLGMSEPTPIDVSFTGEPARVEFDANARSDRNDWCYASREDVERNLASIGLHDAILCQGRVEDTLREPANLPDRIALLRLDTDWYESTAVELEVLYPRLSPGGVLIIDDYGHWQGARRAVDEYFGDKPPLLIAVDYTCRVATKPAA